ncbi:hypothetical protein O7634_31135 [Micromonospora sp. WMMD1120]|uniref:hypothetical protein n=1 Tax=Micromonospora sp. WMMD1120 TaxID=3016106 RepID=UPI002415B53A|nr:hypothetical protein [Micromonospora sp. WMMD1120]MDG4811230.1 hypothetical protein [Micromonospora sp. WMMD1120]
MGESARPVGETIVLGQSRVWPAVAIPGAILVLMIVVWILFDLFVGTVLALGAASVIVASTSWRNAVLADDVGLLVRSRRGLRRSYAWTEIERMGWVDAGMWGSVLTVYPAGGPYDVPGPNASTNVGRIWRPRRRRLADPLPALLAAHDIKTLSDL